MSKLSWNGPKRLEVAFAQSGQLQQVAQESSLKRLMAMNRNRQSNVTSTFPEDVMASSHTQQCPAMTFKNLGQLSAGYRYHTAISRIRVLPSATFVWDTSTDRQPSTAS